MSAVVEKRGGKRAGAGRPITRHLEVVSPVAAAKVTTPQVEGEIPQAPAGLSSGARKVWDRLAPTAHQEATLTHGTVSDFAATCELHVETDKALSAVATQVPGSTEWLQISRIYLSYANSLAVKLRAFRLAPNGLPMIKQDKVEKPKTALEQLRDRRQALTVMK